jgi:branched-chain amino acid transport system permease protein
MFTCGVTRNCGELIVQLLGIGLSNGAIIALNAIAITLLYSAVRSINFAYGDIFALSSVLITSIIRAWGLHWGMPMWQLLGGLSLVLLISIGFSVALHLLLERLAFRPFQGRSRLAPLIATIGFSFMFYQMALLWRSIELQGQTVHKSDLDHVANLPLGGIPAQIPSLNLVQQLGIAWNITYTLKDAIVLLSAILLACAVFGLLRYTRLGKAIRACSQDAEMAELCGINRNAIIMASFSLSGVLAACSAFVFALYYNRPLGQHGIDSGLTAFAAAMLGGIGSPFGALASGLSFGIISAFSDYFLSSRWTPTLLLGLLVALFVARPNGIGGGTETPEPERISLFGAQAGVNTAHKISRMTRILVGLALLYPFLDWLFGWQQQVIMNSIALFAVLALGLNVLLGFAGVLDLGYAAMFAIGGYSAAFISTRLGLWLPWWPQHLDILLVLLLAASITMLIGLINSLLTLRLRHDYLAIVTLALGLIAPRIILNADQFTGGARGMSGIPGPQLLGIAVRSPSARYFLIVALAFLTIVISKRLAQSRIGRAWQAIASDEQAALSCGIDVRVARIQAFAVSSAIAGATGALFASTFSYVNTGQSDFANSAMVLAMVIIGGAGNIRGAVIGALLVMGYNHFAVTQFGVWLSAQSSQSGWGPLLAALDPRSISYLLFGLALYLMVLWRSNGHLLLARK